MSNLFNLAISASALIAIGLLYQDNAVAFAYVKAITTLLILAYWLTAVRHWSRKNYWLGAIALIFCTAGDIALTRVDGFLWGLSFFLLGHLLLIVLFRSIAGARLHWPSTLLIFAFGYAYFFYLFPQIVHLSIPVGVYISVISLMAAWGVAVYRSRRDVASQLIMYGAISFLVSDSVLAYNRFIAEISWMPAVVLLTYWGSLLLITNGASRLR